MGKVIEMFGKRLKAAREAKGLTMDGLADLYKKKFPDTGLNKGTLSKYENEKQEPMVSTVSKLAEILEVSTDYLTGKSNNPGALHNVEVRDEQNNLVVLDEETRNIIDNLRSRPDMKMLFSVSKDATPDDIITAVKIIEALKNKGEGDR